MPNFPFIDLKRIYLDYATELQTSLNRVMESGWFILGEEGKQFESQFAHYHQSGFAVGVGSGTDALVLALKASKLRPGDAVITVSHTAVATVAAIRWAGLIPIFVDIDPQTFTMAPQSVSQAIQLYHEKYPIRAIIPVHLYGHPAPMNDLTVIAENHNLTIIEDCSQAHGATLNGRYVANFGRFGCFSFYPTKNLGAFGDAGAIICHTDADHASLRKLQQYGWEKRYISQQDGYNSRLDELQAALLTVRLKYLRKENKRRQEIASRYTSALTNTTLKPPYIAHGAKSTYHQYTMLTEHRDQVLGYFGHRGIPISILYPQAVHQQVPYCDFPKADLSHTENVTSQLFQLPIYPQLREQEVQQILSSLQDL